MSSKEIIRIIAHKMKVTNTEDYALYTLENGKGKNNKFFGSV